ncbi:MAG: hypothetical protein ACYDEO_09715 [Aggregatilineales bacterium]
MLLIALIVTGRPMLEFGFNWLSYTNNDMANYVLRAERLLNNGFFDVPSLSRMTNFQDYTLFYWFLDVPAGSRVGADLLLSWVISLTGLNGLQIFMPVILSFHLALISAAGGLVCASRRYRLAALATCGLLAFSALTSLGVLYQLIAQVLGLALLIAAVTVVFHLPKAQMRRATAIRHGILISLLVSALMIVYPEVTPFLALSFIVYIAIQLIRNRSEMAWAALVYTFGPAILLVLIFLNVYVLEFLRYLIAQTSQGSTTAVTYLFPFYLVPSGLADLWGLQSLAFQPAEPWGTTSILVGGFLIILSLIVIGIQVWRKQRAAVVAAVMFGLSFYLFIHRVGFSLFKLAMYVQPFVLAVLTIAWLSFSRKRHIAWQLLPLVILCVVGLPTQYSYVEASRGLPKTLGAFVSIPNPSSSQIMTEFQQLITANPASTVLSDTQSLVLAKYQAAQTRDVKTIFLSQVLPFSSLTFRSLIQEENFVPYQETTTQLWDVLDAQLAQRQFNLHDPNDPKAADSFLSLGSDPNLWAKTDDPLLVLTTPQQNILNRYPLRSDTNVNFVAQPLSQSHNYLVLVNSELGQQNYGGKPGAIALFPLEPDFANSGKSFAAMGRHILLLAINPTSPVRMILNLTGSLSISDKTIPPAAVIGTNRQFFPIVGRGSARVVSPPLTFQNIDGFNYVELDMGMDGFYFPDQRPGLVGLYGSDLRLDARKLVGFVRDISLISDAEYAAVSPPTFLKSFPQDLDNPDLEYSGIYEDGWVSESSFVRLTQPQDANALVVRGTVPMVNASDFSTEVSVLVDGQEVGRQTLGLGHFELRVPVSGQRGRHQIDLRFSKWQQLPAPDGRPVAALLSFIGFETPASAAATTPPTFLKSFPQDLSNPDLDYSGIYGDGWATESGFVRLTQPEDANALIVRGTVPMVNASDFSTEVSVLVDGQEVGRQTLGIGHFELRLLVSAQAGPHQIDLRFSKGQQLPAPDGRPAAALLSFVGYETPSSEAVTSPPIFLKSFPQDLDNPDLEYSGIYKDGWVTESSFVRLTQPQDARDLVVRGMVPMVNASDFTTELSVLVDGQEIGRQTLGIGHFELRLPVSGQGGRHQIDLRFSKWQQLPVPDGRPAAALLSFIGYETPSAK